MQNLNHSYKYVLALNGLPLKNPVILILIPALVILENVWQINKLILLKATAINKEKSLNQAQPTVRLCSASALL